MDEIIRTYDLSFSFGKQLVVNKLALNVPEGSIYGFLGPNGAGKSTTIRLLLGLLPSEKDSVKIFDRSINRHRHAILRRIGNMIEGPSYYGHLSAVENLRIFAKLLGKSVHDIDRVLGLMGMWDAKHKQTGKFSLGMKQRLGLAIALLPDPDLLILDEPTNGLDPQGIHEVRQLIKELNEVHGKSIFLSSHLLAEIEQVADHIGIIQNGALLFQGNLKQLESENDLAAIRMKIPDAEHAGLIKNSMLVRSFHSIGAERYSCQLKEDTEMRDFIDFLKRSPIYFEELSPIKSSLESIFLSLTTSKIC